MNDLLIRIQNVLIPLRLFSSFERHVPWETDRYVEVMGIGFGKDYQDGKKIILIIIPDQQRNQQHVQCETGVYGIPFPWIPFPFPDLFSAVENHTFSFLFSWFPDL